MNCPKCSTPHAEAARFCAHCGTALNAATARAEHFAAMPDQPVRIAAIVSTLLPHLSGRHQYAYRRAIALALFAALIAAAIGSLPVALILAAVALPAIVLTYYQDHNVWRGQPIAVIGIGFVLALALGVGVGLLHNYLGKGSLLSSATGELPSVNRIFQLGILIPVVTYLGLLVAPLLLTARTVFRHPVDALVTSALSGAAFSLGMSVVLQWGAFSAGASGDAAHVAFIALTLGFAQPIIFATAAAITVMPLREGLSPGPGVGRGLVLVVIYQLAGTLLAPFGSRGIVLTAVVALTAAAAGLIGARMALQEALIAEAAEAAGGRKGLAHPAHADEACAHCGAAMADGDAFCQACGSSTATLPRYAAKPTRAKASR